MKPLSASTPHVIVMIGIPGAGKSTFAEHFARTFQAPIVNVSEISKLLDVSESVGVIAGDLLLDELLKTKRTIVYEGPTATKISRTELTKKVIAAGYEPLLVWVQTESIEAKRRATKKQKDNTQLSDDQFDQAIKRFNPPSAAEKIVVISGKHTYTSQLKIVLKRLAGQQPSEIPIETPRTRPSRTIILR